MTEYRAETIIGIISIFAVIVFVPVLLSHPTYGLGRVVLVFACLASVISCVMALTASGKFGNNILRAHNELGVFSPYLVPYSIIITGVGGILAAVVLVLLVIETCNMNNREVPNQQGQTVTMANYSQDVRQYTVPSQNSGYRQPAGATRPYAQQNAKRPSHLVVSKSFPSENHPMTNFTFDF